jgi:hypothetical protein
MKRHIRFQLMKSFAIFLIAKKSQLGVYVIIVLKVCEYVGHKTWQEIGYQG